MNTVVWNTNKHKYEINPLRGNKAPDRFPIYMKLMLCKVVKEHGRVESLATSIHINESYDV